MKGQSYSDRLLGRIAVESRRPRFVMVVVVVSKFGSIRKSFVSYFVLASASDIEAN